MQRIWMLGRRGQNSTVAALSFVMFASLMGAYGNA
jgi:hypothetical protein